MKTKFIDTWVKEYQSLNKYIESLQRRKQRLESSLVSTTKYSVDRVKSSPTKSIDDTYSEIIDAETEINKVIAESIQKQRELQSYIDTLENYESRCILSMHIIEGVGKWEICDFMGLGERTFYRNLKKAKEELEQSYLDRNN